MDYWSRLIITLIIGFLLGYGLGMLIGEYLYSIIFMVIMVISLDSVLQFIRNVGPPNTQASASKQKSVKNVPEIGKGKPPKPHF